MPLQKAHNGTEAQHDGYAELQTALRVCDSQKDRGQHLC